MTSQPVWADEPRRPARRLLFVCSRNQWRSPTAAWLFGRDPRFEVRSAGTSPRARRPVTERDLRWADVVFVMEPKHRNRLRAAHSRAVGGTPIHVLDIADDYQFRDPELVDLLESTVTPLLDR